jgi:hypothetical protein
MKEVAPFRRPDSNALVAENKQKITLMKKSLRLNPRA